MKKIDKVSGRAFECSLADDGTLDTVLLVDGKEYRFDSDYVARLPDGTIPARELERLFDEVIDEIMSA
jgi:hypothetical protein